MYNTNFVSSCLYIHKKKNVQKKKRKKGIFWIAISLDLRRINYLFEHLFETRSILLVPFYSYRKCLLQSRNLLHVCIIVLHI